MILEIINKSALVLWTDGCTQSMHTQIGEDPKSIHSNDHMAPYYKFISIIQAKGGPIMSQIIERPPSWEHP